MAENTLPYPTEPDLFVPYASKNVEMAMISYKAFEYGRNIAAEQSAGMSMGIDDHAIKRQRGYVAEMTDRINSIHARPIPDLPHIHPVRFDIDLRERYKEFTKDGLTLNEDAELLTRYWLMLAVTAAACQSNGMGGSMIDADHERMIEQLNVITKFLDEVDNRPIVDVPETTFNAAMLELKAVPPTPKK